MPSHFFKQRQREQVLLSQRTLSESPLCGRWWTLPTNTERLTEGGKRLRQGPKQNSDALPLVTVITVAYNRVPTIEKCLQSVFAQTYSAIEYIVIDGGSTDGSLAILQKHESDIDYFVSEPDHGIYDAMNKGLGLASGEYIIFLNSDDWYRTDAIELLVQTARKENADITHADATVINSKGKKYSQIDHLLHDGLYTSVCLVRHETMLVSRSVYEQLGGYDTVYRIIADYLFVMRAYYSGFRFYHVRQNLLYFSNLGVSSTERTQREKERAKLFSSLFPFLAPQDINSIVRWPLGTKEISNLISKYPDKSELFVRSLATNIVQAPSVLIAQVVFEKFGQSMKQSLIWKRSGKMRRWVYDSFREILN